jgi:2-methylcitrate dehydratase PrpD
MGEANWKLVGKPYDAGLDSVVHAQFNAAYSFARALADGRVGPGSYERPAITAPAVVALADRVRVVNDPGIDEDAMAPVKVAITLRDGRSVTRESATIKGSPEEPMSEREILDKLRGCLEFGGYPPSAGERIAEAGASLERAADAGRALVAAFP